jgi:hypothetical protein
VKRLEPSRSCYSKCGIETAPSIRSFSSKRWGTIDFEWSSFERRISLSTLVTRPGVRTTMEFLVSPGYRRGPVIAQDRVGNQHLL